MCIKLLEVLLCIYNALGFVAQLEGAHYCNHEVSGLDHVSIWGGKKKIAKERGDSAGNTCTQCLTFAAQTS